jgi:transcriptional regulator with XRE-family HTH domain
MSISVTPRVGDLLRDWRQRRRLSQLDLAIEADISTRHLSYIETGRARPSRDMVLALAEELGVPLRERNVLLTAAGFAPVYPQRSLDDPSLQAARQAIDLVLKGHEPYPALAIDRRWILVASNTAVTPLLAGIDPALLQGQVNVLRLSLHPKGLAPRIGNLVEWRGHLLERLRRQIELTADAALIALMAELKSFPVPQKSKPHGADGQLGAYGGVVVPLHLRTEAGDLSLLSTTTVFGTPVDVTLSELALECFYPADTQTASALRRLSAMD